MKTVTGDLIALALQGEFDVIVHGCNCFCTMGAGIANTIRATFPEAWAADQATANGDRSKLGSITFAKVVREGRTLFVVNAYTQFGFSRRDNVADLDAISQAMETVRYTFSGLRIGYPKIGAGLAGGVWSQIAPRIDDALSGEDHTLVVLG